MLKTIACPSCEDYVPVEVGTDYHKVGLCGDCFHSLKDEVKEQLLNNKEDK